MIRCRPKSRSGESAQGEFRLADELCKVISKAQSLYIKQRFAKGVQRNITDFFKALITTDGIKIFSMTFYTLVTVYCPYKIVKDAFRIVLYDDGDGNQDVKKLKSNRSVTQNNNFARASRFFVHFFTVLARLRRENA